MSEECILNPLSSFEPKILSEAGLMFRSEYKRICQRTDRMIAALMCLQWPGAIIAAVVIASHPTSCVPSNIMAAIFCGGAIALCTILLAAFCPGERYTRHIIAACQMGMSGLLIQISGGHIETHFHVFGSLAFLALYLDWQVLATATIVTLVDHSLVGIYWPQAMFGMAMGQHFRIIEHALWVLFCVVFLMISSRQRLSALRILMEREATQEALLHQAYHDSLTGLGNRLQLQTSMQEAWQKTADQGTPFALMTIALDHFKETNDLLGRPIGDALLIEASRRLQGQMRAGDTLVRLGGDEFAVVLGNCLSTNIAEVVATRIISCFKEAFTCVGQTVRLGASIGISHCSDASISVEDLLHHAELALYKVKNTGCNRHLVFDEQMRAETLFEMSMEHRLRVAIREGSMRVHYQPLVNAHGLLLGFEALVRWKDAVHGDIPPNRFIPVAERTGMIIPLGEWVLRQACKQAAAWHQAGHSIVKMSVNVSSVQIAQESFVATVMSVLEETGLRPEFLDLELTESVLIENHGEILKRLAALRRAGVRLSIDDFGTGYSSFSYLRDLPVHTLKIDRSFVSSIEESAETRRLIEGMIQMAHSLHLKTVAEGVENEKQLEILALAECDVIQGFHISKALPADAAGQLMSDRNLQRDAEAAREMKAEEVPVLLEDALPIFGVADAQAI